MGNSIQFKKWRHFILGAALVLFIAVILRIFNLLALPIFVDEAIYIRWAQIMRAEPSLRFLPLSDGKQPLFMWTVMPFLKVFSDPLLAGRMVSVFCGLGGMFGIYLVAYELFKNRRLALIASLLGAVSPFMVFFDRLALVDSMLAMFGIWTLFFAVKTAKTLRLDCALIAGFFLGGALLTKSPGVFFLLLLPTTVFFLPSKKSGLFNSNLLKLFSFWMAIAFVAFVIYNILRLGPNFDKIGTRNSDYLFSLQEILKNPFEQFFIHWELVGQWFLYLLPGTTLVLAIIGVFGGIKKLKKEIIMLLLWTFLPLIIQTEVARVFTARYILFAIFPLFILAAFGLVNVINLKFSKSLAVLFIFLAPSLLIDYLLLQKPDVAPLPKDERAGYLEGWTSGGGIREVAEYIKNQHNKEPDKPILVGTEGFFGTLPDGLQIYIEDIDNITIKGVGTEVYQVDEALINAKKAGNEVYLVVNRSRLHNPPEDLGIELINEYKKTIKPNGTQDALLLFKVTSGAINTNNLRHAKNSQTS